MNPNATSSAPLATRPAMTNRQRFHAVMNYEPADRGVYLMPWFGFPETFDRWREQGYHDGDLDRFNVDPISWIGHWFFPYPPFEHKVIEEDERHILYVNHEGIIMRELKDNPMGSMPQFVKFPVETREEFRAFAKEHLQPDVFARMGPFWREEVATLNSGDSIVWIIADRWGGFFGPLRNLLGVEQLCMKFYTDPALLEEMMEVIGDYVIAQAGQLLDHLKVDAFGLWEDMGFNKGPLISPDLVRRYMLPYYQRVTEFLRSRGVKWISLDSDGQVTDLLPLWLEGGFNILYPFEVAAHMDVVECRRRLGQQMRVYMAVDKRALKAGPAAIDAEIERLRPLIEEGGFIPNVDHSIPPDITWANFQYYMEKMAKVLGVSEVYKH